MKVKYNYNYIPNKFVQNEEKRTGLLLTAFGDL